jgi:hypothetical protein
VLDYFKHQLQPELVIRHGQVKKDMSKFHQLLKRTERRKDEVITVRVTPKLKYGLELLSRKQHRPLSSVVTWAIEQMMTNSDAGLFKSMKSSKDKMLSEQYMLETLWDVHPANRLIKLAIHWPELLTYEEELIVQRLKDNGHWPKNSDEASEYVRDNWADVVKD